MHCSFMHGDGPIGPSARRRDTPMLISLRKEFIFVANLKTASTAIEKQLRSVCEVAILQTRFGKHHGLDEIEKRFSWVFDYVRRDEMFVFGVIRDPVDFLVSLYNFHKEAFLGQPSYTGGISFEQFMSDWTRRNSWQCRPQSERFRNKEGVFDLDYLIDYAKLDEQLAQVCRILKVRQAVLTRENVSPPDFSRDQVPEEMAARIRSMYPADMEYLTTATGRVLRERPAAVAARVAAE
jgi:hypothetical protein